METALLIRQLLHEPAPQTVVNRWRSRPLRQAVDIVATSVALGLLYPVFGDGFASVIPFINGFVIGLLGGISVSFMELNLSRRLRKKAGFLTLVLLKTFLYTITLTACVLLVILVSRSLLADASLAETWTSDGFQHFIFQEDFFIIVIYALISITVVIFTLEMSRKMGQGVLLNFVTGKYFSPKKVRRIFMFLDLDDSVSHAEAMGDMEYHTLLNEFFRDITPGITAAKGKIHHYVGDEVVVSWPSVLNGSTSHCLLAYLYSFHIILNRSDHYRKHYGFVPAFKAAFHCGEVIYGEMGEVKSEIVFHGDTINTTARMERLCTVLQEPMLISETLLNTFPPEVQQLFGSAGTVQLKGKKKGMQVFSPAGETLLNRHRSSVVPA